MILWLWRGMHTLIVIWYTVRIRTRYWWLRLTGKCVVCGGPRMRLQTFDTFVHPDPYACRWCNKRSMHAENYGMGADRRAR